MTTTTKKKKPLPPGLYIRGPYYWMNFTPPGQTERVQASTKVLVMADAAPAVQKEQLRLAGIEMAHARAGVQAAKHAHALATGSMKVPTDKSITFGEWADYYETHFIKHHGGAPEELRRLRTTLVPFFEGRQLHTLAVEDYDALLAEVAQRRVKGVPVRHTTVNLYGDLFKSMMREAKVRKHITANPFAGLPKRKGPKVAKRAMSADEQAAVVAAITDPADRALLLVGIETLVRIGDLLDLRYEHDRGAELVIVDPKNGEPHYAPVTAGVREALDELKKQAHPSGYFFHHRRIAKAERDWAGAVRQMFRRACKRAGVAYGRKVGGLVWHRATRATGASRLVRAGANAIMLKAIGGWKDIRSAEGYVTPDTDVMRDLAEAASALGRKSSTV